MPSSSSVSAACRIVSQSEREPMMIPTTGASAIPSSLLRPRLLQEQRRDGARGLAELGVLVVRVGDAVEELDRVALGRPVPKTDDREPPHRDVRVTGGQGVQQRPERVDVAGMRPREALERDQRRASRSRALVLEAAAEQLELLPEPELRDRAVRLRADAVVGVARPRLDLLVPLRAKLRECALVACLREGVRLGSRLGEAHGPSGPWAWRGAGNREIPRALEKKGARGGNMVSSATASRRRAVFTRAGASAGPDRRTVQTA